MIKKIAKGLAIMSGFILPVLKGITILLLITVPFSLLMSNGYYTAGAIVFTITILLVIAYALGNGEM